MEYAAHNNSNIRNAYYDQEIGKKQAKEIRGRALPQANINGSYDDRLKLPFLVIPGGNALTGTEAIKIKSGYQYNSNLSGEITQAVFDPSIAIGLKVAKYNNLLYSQKAYQVTEQTAFDIAISYYKVIIAQKKIDLLQSNITSTSKTLASTKLQFENGVAKPVDVKRLQVNVSNLRSQMKQAQLILNQSLNDLKLKMGMPMEQKIILSDTTLVYNPDEVVLPEESNFFENRIDYKILQSNLQLQRFDVQNTIRGYYPVLTAYINYGFTGQGRTFAFAKTPGNNWVDYTTSSFGLRLKFPVFDGFQRVARAQQSRLKARQIEENMTLAKLTINHDVANTYIQYRNTIDRIDTESQNVELAKEVYQITQLEFREGVSTSTALVDAENSLSQAQNTYIQTLVDLYSARLSLEKSKGNLLNYLNSK